MNKLQDTGKRVVARVLAGLDRADEIGGEIRDYLQERVLVDERYVRLRKRMAALRGKTYVSMTEAEAARTARQRDVAAAAPPPAASVVTQEKGLGNADIAAQIFGKNSCPWSGRAIRLLEDHKVDYDYVDLDDSDNEHYGSRLIAETRQNTTPWIFVRGQFIGGFNALSELQRAGQLEYALMTPEERKNANPALASITIAPRPNSDEVVSGDSD
jgi:glutaredoxin